jgi:D-beta-D-heptose 7-phosphate kinase/D-beta-D-heptose 1-phosphate adenosyltransferase
MSEPIQHARSLLRSVETLGRPRVLVLGDLILDRYTWGDAERVSQEAPVIVLRAERHEARLGGAANVAHMVRGLGCPAACIGITGDDADAGAVRGLLQACDVDPDGIVLDASRPTTVKERFIGRAQGKHSHQILRVDREVRRPPAAALEAELSRRVELALPHHQLLLVSDYGKGVCTPGVVAAAIEAARRRGVPVIVDPMRLPAADPAGYEQYRRATTMTPNRTEAELAAGLRIDSPETALLAAERLCRRYELAMAVVTLDRDGMALFAPGEAGRPTVREVFPTRPLAVYDITGAGDMVLATIGVALASGLPPADAVRLGNVAGGLEVEKVGVAIVTRDELRERILHWEHEERCAAAASGAGRRLAAEPATEGKIVSRATLVERVAAHRAAGRRIVFTNGCFDLLHAGHLTCLEQARRHGDVLIVAINGDESVRRLKGPRRPITNQDERARLLAALSCVDEVTIFDEATPEPLLELLRPDVLVKGGAYAPDQVVGRAIVESYGGVVALTGVVPGRSTTEIVERTRRSDVPAPHFVVAGLAPLEPVTRAVVPAPAAVVPSLPAPAPTPPRSPRPRVGSRRPGVRGSTALPDEFLD